VTKEKSKQTSQENRSKEKEIEIEKLQSTISTLEKQVKILTELLKELCKRTPMPDNERNEILGQINHITSENKNDQSTKDLQHNTVEDDDLNDLEETEGRNADNAEKVVYDYSVNEIGKDEKTRNTSQRNDLELEYSGAVQLNHQTGKRAKHNNNMKSNE